MNTGVIFVVTLIMSACASTTMIRVTDPGVKIYVDGEYRGIGSVSHTDKKVVGSTTSVRLEKTGCQPVTNTFSRNEEFSVGACIGGALVLVPFLWVMDYKAERTFEFACQPTSK